MPKKETPIETLQQFLPAGTYDMILDYLRKHKVHLTVSRKRNSILGDYRHKTNYTNHRISVNGNLNSYSFLITLLHELAHLLTFEQHGNKVQSHGREWKMIYSKLLEYFLSHKLFPADIERELLRSINNPAASSCAEDGLMRILRKYDLNGNAHKLLEELPVASLFRIEDGRIFKKGIKLRKRFKCIEIKTGKEYLFSPVYEVVVGEW
jgi:hypothetical protein